MAKNSFSNVIDQSLLGRVSPPEPSSEVVAAAEVKTESQPEPSEKKAKQKTEKKISEKAEKQNTSKEVTPKPEKNVSKGAPFMLNKKDASKKTNHSFYLTETNYEKLTSLAKENGMSTSEVLNEILNQILN